MWTSVKCLSIRCIHPTIFAMMIMMICASFRWCAIFSCPPQLRFFWSLIKLWQKWTCNRVQSFTNSTYLFPVESDKCWIFFNICWTNFQESKIINQQCRLQLIHGNVLWHNRFTFCTVLLTIQIWLRCVKCNNIQNK